MRAFVGCFFTIDFIGTCNYYWTLWISMLDDLQEKYTTCIIFCIYSVLFFILFYNIYDARCNVITLYSQ